MHSRVNYDIISQILPINCEAYLTNKGWTETGRLGDLGKIFGTTDDSGRLVEVLVPTKTTYKDFNNVVLHLLVALQDFESRSLEYIANDILLSKYDVFRIIAFKGDTTPSLPLEDASTLFNKSLSMMAAAAQSIITPSSYFQSRRSNEVNDFLSKLRMGHTERGSFIVTLQTPIAPDMRLPGVVEPILEEEPFERRVSVRLCSLISEAQTIATEQNSEALSRSVANGMSANFFESLADITKVCGNVGANMDMTWATIRPIQRDWGVPDRFVIRKEMVDSLREAGRTLRATMPEDGVEIAGYVTALHRETGAEVGNIKLHDIMSSPTRMVSIDLPSDRYDEACRAHSETKMLVVKGDLRKNGRVQSLINISEFGIVEANEFANGNR